MFSLHGRFSKILWDSGLKLMPLQTYILTESSTGAFKIVGDEGNVFA